MALIDICKCSLQKQNADQWSRFYVSLNNELFSYYVYDHFREYFAVNLEAHFVFASGTQNAVRQTNFALSHFNASCSYSVSDVASTDGTEQFTFVASFRRDGNSFQCIDFLSASISCCQNFSQFSFQSARRASKNSMFFLVAGTALPCGTRKLRA